MQAISDLITVQNQNTETTFDFEAHNQHWCDNYNKTIGSLQGYDCSKCKNRGYFARIVDGYEVLTPCECLKLRETLHKIEKSGLKGSINKLTFDSFKTNAHWQELIKIKAKSFVENNNGKWFYIGGQVGCGKTHICTAIVGELFKQGKTGQYMLWRDEAVKLKASVNDYAVYKDIMDPLKTVDVLYIDDFFKTEKNKQPTQADINVAFEILNHRYSNDKITVISSERTIDELLDIDEAVGSRIYEKTKESNIIIGQDRNKNYRLRGADK